MISQTTTIQTARGPRWLPTDEDLLGVYTPRERARGVTTWTNESKDTIRFDVQVPEDEDGHLRIARIEFAPGETRRLPALLDVAIHAVTRCDHGAPCHAYGQGSFCRQLDKATAPAIVSGGLAPLLRREPQSYGVDDVLRAHLSPSAAAAARVAAGAAPEEDPAYARALARRAAK